MARNERRATTFGPWLESQLTRREWTGSDLRRKVGVRPSVVSRWVRGERTPSPESVDKIADALMVDVDEALTLAGHRPALPTDAIERVHAQLDPYLLEVLDDPAAIGTIVRMVRSFVEGVRGDRRLSGDAT